MRTLRIIMCLAMAVSPLQTRAIKAQEVPLIRPGDRVRVTAPECQLREQMATLLSLEKDFFSATVGDTDIQCPVEALTQLERSVGERKWWKASLLGLGVGVGVGAIGVLVITSDPPPYDDMYGMVAFIWAIASTTAALLVGTGIGIVRGRDHWKEVPLPLVQPSLFVSRGSRLNLSISIPLRR